MPIRTAFAISLQASWFAAQVDTVSAVAPQVGI